MDNIEPTLKEYLKDCKKLVILGIGNTMKGDDGVGIVIVENLLKHHHLKEDNCQQDIDSDQIGRREINKISNDIIILNCGVVPENFTDVLRKEKPDKIIIIDAAIMGEEPGTIKIIDPEDISKVGFSTHSLPLSLIVKYIKYHINTEIIIVGIEPENLDFGKSLSKKVYERSLEFTDILKDILCSFENKESIS
ncbi:MAG TPA: hydrogenase maturation peptidase HycI [Methanothermococcus okinawensis]|uniref:Hydrogenase maturation peptidase HycI n=1 Tax=Methanothermococcus okinawensis TaxID=155863 RepID=A0A833DQW9_9EURY|nr:hydrogenase maturation peptidase HycI [Methanothermococcus okinawensis]